MATPTQSALVDVLLHRHGRTFASEAGIRVERNTPSALFQLLCLALLISARIRGEVAMTASRALREAGWTTPDKMAHAPWTARAEVLDEAGYSRYDESTSRYLGATSVLLVDRYGGDLRRLRAEADGSNEVLTRRLTEFPGIGKVGAAFFLREVQVAWDELEPFIDARARTCADALGLPTDPEQLRALAPGEPFSTLVAALVRACRADDLDALRRLSVTPPRG